MKVSYVLVVVVIIVVILGFRVLVGRYFTLEGRTLGAELAREKASKRCDHAARALSALLEVQLQPGDSISEMLFAACNRWDVTIGAHLSPEDPVQQSMKKARQEFTAADSALSLAQDRVQTLRGPDPYGLHVVKNDPAGEAAAYQLAIDTGHADVAPNAAFNLGLLRGENGDSVGAAVAFQLAIDSGHVDWAPKAAVDLGLLRAENGDPVGAAAAYQLAIDTGHADVAPVAAYELGLLRALHGDPVGAAAAFQLAIDSGHADMAPQAAVNLGEVREAHGDPVGAAAAFQLAIDSGHADMAPVALEKLSKL